MSFSSLLFLWIISWIKKFFLFLFWRTAEAVWNFWIHLFTGDNEMTYEIKLNWRTLVFYGCNKSSGCSLTLFLEEKGREWRSWKWYTKIWGELGLPSYSNPKILDFFFILNLQIAKKFNFSRPFPFWSRDLNGFFSKIQSPAPKLCSICGSDCFWPPLLTHSSAFLRNISKG